MRDLLRRTSGMLVLVPFLLSAMPANAQGVRYTIAPAVERVWWDDALPIAEEDLFGLRVGADFGRLVGVTAWYHTRKDVGVALSETDLRTFGGNLFADQTTDITSFGANLAIKLGVGRVVPFVHAGAGIMRFEPAAASTIEQINYRYGGGLQYDAARNIRATLTVEDSRFRLSPEALSPETPDVPTADPEATRSNWTVSAALGFALGGPLDRRGAGADTWSFASIPVEPFVGRLEFEDKSLPRQTLAGVRAGIDFGNYLGVRGVYWQGRSDNLRERQPMRGYGAEAQFNLNASLGPAPYLIAGASRIDFEAGYVDTLGVTREDETALVLGGGMGLRLSDNFRLNVAARDFIRSSRDFDDVTSADQLSHNWLLSAGLGFNIGRSRGTSSDEAQHPRMHAPATMDELEEEMRPRREARMVRDSAVAPRAMRMTDVMDTNVVVIHKDSTTGRVIVLPVPESGELYVRYGTSSSLKHKMMGSDSSAPSASPSGMTTTELEMLVKTLMVKIDSLLAAKAATPVAATAPAPTMVIIRERQPESAEAPMAPVVIEATLLEDATPSSQRIHSASPYIAGFDALVVGVQLDAGPLFGMEAVRMVPEFAIGVSGDASILFALGGEYRFRSLKVSENGAGVEPHVRVSLGLLAAGGDTDSQFGINVAYGVTFGRTAREDGSVAPKLFVEHQGIGFFDHNRIAAGVRWLF